MSGPDPASGGHGAFDARTYWERRLDRHPGREGVGHAGLGEGLNGWMYRVRRRVFLRELAPLMPTLPARSVLDVGSGTGFYLDRWREAVEASNSFKVLDVLPARRFVLTQGDY